MSEEPGAIIGAVELPTPTDTQPQQSLPSHKRYNSGDNYYEDVDPRFAEPAPVVQPNSPMPTSLMPGHYPSTSNFDNGNTHLEPSSSYESIQDGAATTATTHPSHNAALIQTGDQDRAQVKVQVWAWGESRIGDLFSSREICCSQIQTLSFRALVEGVEVVSREEEVGCQVARA